MKAYSKCSAPTLWKSCSSLESEPAPCLYLFIFSFICLVLSSMSIPKHREEGQLDSGLKSERNPMGEDIRLWWETSYCRALSHEPWRGQIKWKEAEWSAVYHTNREETPWEITSKDYYFIYGHWSKTTWVPKNTRTTEFLTALILQPQSGTFTFTQRLPCYICSSILSCFVSTFVSDETNDK